MWNKMKSTRFKKQDGQKLLYANFGHKYWRIIHYDPLGRIDINYSVVGPHYTSETELLGDLDRYATEIFGF